MPPPSTATCNAAQASFRTNSTQAASSGIKSGWSKTLTRASDCRARTPRTTGRPPDLRIVSQELFDAAQSRKQARGHTHPNQQRRPRHMLSGLLRCGACGAGMSTNGKDNSGRIRIRCSAAAESGSCQDAKTFYLKTVERAVLAGLESEMRHPQVIAEYARTYHEERKRLSAKANAKRAHLAFRLGELNREIDRLVDAIAKGHGDPAVLGPRSSVLNEERKQVTMEMNLEPAGNDTISLHPAVLARYQEQLVELQDARYQCRRFRRGGGDQRPCRDRNSLPRPLAPGGRHDRNRRAPKCVARGAGVSQQGSGSVGKDGSGRALHRITHYGGSVVFLSTASGLIPCTGSRFYCPF